MEAYENKKAYDRARTSRVAYKREWYESNRVRIAARMRENRYGISSEYFDTLLESQGHACAVCGTDLDSLPTHRVHVDHDHSHCGDDIGCPECVRGILCVRCNRHVSHVEAGNARPDAPHRARAAKAWPPGHIEDIQRYLSRPPAHRYGPR